MATPDEGEEELLARVRELVDDVARAQAMTEMLDRLHAEASVEFEV